MDKRKIPNLFIVGAPRCGTTALYDYLMQHTDVFMANREVSYFSRDLHKESDVFHKKEKSFLIRKEKEYLELFSKAKEETILCDFSTAYLYSKVAASNIHDFNPAAKIIIMVRNPVDFMYSLHSRLCYNGVEDIEDFREALEAEGERRKGSNIPASVVYPSSLFYVERAHFRVQIKRYLDVFDRWRVRVVLYDKFRNDNENVLKDILDFMGVSNEFCFDFKEYNQNKKPRFRLLSYFLSTVRRMSIIQLFPASMRKKIGIMLIKANTKYEPRKTLDDELINHLMIKFKNEVTDLNIMLHNRGLLNEEDLNKEWGYDLI